MAFNYKLIEAVKTAGQRVRVVLPYNDKYLLETLNNPKWPDNVGKRRFIGGGIDEGETPEQAATRELMEELGVEADSSKFKFLGLDPKTLEHYLEYASHGIEPGDYKATVGSDPIISLKPGLPEGSDYIGPDLKSLTKQAGRFDFLKSLMKSKSLASTAGKVKPNPVWNATTFAQNNPGMKGLTLNKVPGAKENLSSNFAKEHGSFGNLDPAKVPGAGQDFKINFAKEHPNLGKLDLSKVESTPNTWFEQTAPGTAGFKPSAPPATHSNFLKSLSHEFSSPVYASTGEQLARTGLGFAAAKIPGVALRGGLNAANTLGSIGSRVALGLGTTGAAAYTRLYPRLVELSHKSQEIEDMPQRLSEAAIAAGRTYNRYIEEQQLEKVRQNLDKINQGN